MQTGHTSRLITQLLYQGRVSARGPALLQNFLSDSQLHGMFEHINTTYDVQNHILTVGRDIHWRHVLGSLVRTALCGYASKQLVVYDMATGTGDVALELARRCPGARIIGVDYSGKMLDVAARKIARHAGRSGRVGDIELVHADIRETSLPGKSADAVTISYAIRNIPDRERVFAEFRRLLKPGGKLYIMDFGLPESPAARFLYGLYLDHIMPFVGNLLSRTDYAYSYLRESVRGFPAPQQFAADIAQAGFDPVRIVRLSFGLSVIYCATRI